MRTGDDPRGRGSTGRGHADPMEQVAPTRERTGTPPRRLPPGQVLARTWPVMHYGRVPVPDLDTWDLRIIGSTRDGRAPSWSFCDLLARPQVEAVADFHCVTGLSRLEVRWTGVAVRDLVAEAAPAAGVTHALVWAEHGYCANVRLEDLLAPQSLFAYACDGEPLAPERGWPLRLVMPQLYAWKGPKWVRGIELLTQDRQGFWEQQGYHSVGDVWAEQRLAT